MSDIVERLRRWAEIQRTPGFPKEQMLEWEAAAEIERLRAASRDLLIALEFTPNNLAEAEAHAGDVYAAIANLRQTLVSERR